MLLSNAEVNARSNGQKSGEGQGLVFSKTEFYTI
jgi:hypothetical protein